MQSPQICPCCICAALGRNSLTFSWMCNFEVKGRFFWMRGVFKGTILPSEAWSWKVLSHYSADRVNWLLGKAKELLSGLFILIFFCLFAFAIHWSCFRIPSYITLPLPIFCTCVAAIRKYLKTHLCHVGRINSEYHEGAFPASPELDTFIWTLYVFTHWEQVM